MKLIIFDMDGTLVDTGSVIANTINYVRNYLDLQPLDKNTILENLNDPSVHSPKFFYNCENYTQEQVELFHQYYHENCTKDIELYDGINELLTKLHNKYKLCVATNASSNFAKQILSHLEVINYFEHIIGADMVINPKPHADMIQYVIDKYCIDKEHCIVIGDSLKDSMAASKAGIQSITVNWGFTDHNESTTINNVRELEKLLINF